MPKALHGDLRDGDIHGRKVMAETGLGVSPSGARLFPCEARAQVPPLAARRGPGPPRPVCPVRAGA